ncbi:hypothetical protein DY000_02061552 [Brassica cretica]|uniref:Uncharacterized protein n=1 Tax=Brassica cretica TaxID=69181 RepID=A0ABQ7AN80_BRACR|nr:hypothetical protein DY000_02061552 [Brassica cretica]
MRLLDEVMLVHELKSHNMETNRLELCRSRLNLLSPTVSLPSSHFNVILFRPAFHYGAVLCLEECRHYKKTAAYRGKKSSVCRRNNVIPTTYRRNKSSEITPRKFIFPRKSLGNFRRNSEEMNFQGNSEDHKFVGKVLGIYRGKNSSGYFDGLSDGPILGSSDEMFLGIFIGNFRGTEPSENFEERVPRYIPRKESLGIFRGRSPSVYSEEMFVENFRGFISSEFQKK